MLYRQYGWLCVCLLYRVYCSNAIVSLNCYTAKCGRRNAEVRMGVASQARLPWLSSPHFIMFSGYQFNKKSVPKIRSHFINKQRHPFWPFSSLTWCCALLLHKSTLNSSHFANVCFMHLLFRLFLKLFKSEREI